MGIGVGHLWRFSAFVVYMRDAGWSCILFICLFIFCVALRVAFMGHWGGTLVAFTVLVGFIGHWGWTFVVLFSICSVYEVCRLVCLLYLFIVWRGVALRVAFMGHWGGTLVAFIVLAGFYWAFGLDVCGVFQRL